MKHPLVTPQSLTSEKGRWLPHQRQQAHLFSRFRSGYLRIRAEITGSRRNHQSIYMLASDMKIRSTK